MSECKCKWELYEEDSAICEECKELLEHPKELAKELIKTQAKVKELEQFLEHEDDSWWENRLALWKRQIEEVNDE